MALHGVGSNRIIHVFFRTIVHKNILQKHSYRYALFFRSMFVVERMHFLFSSPNTTCFTISHSFFFNYILFMCFLASLSLSKERNREICSPCFSSLYFDKTKLLYLFISVSIYLSLFVIRNFLSSSSALSSAKCTGRVSVLMSNSVEFISFCLILEKVRI